MSKKKKNIHRIIKNHFFLVFLSIIVVTCCLSEDCHPSESSFGSANVTISMVENSAELSYNNNSIEIENDGLHKIVSLEENEHENKNFIRVKGLPNSSVYISYQNGRISNSEDTIDVIAGKNQSVNFENSELKINLDTKISINENQKDGLYSTNNKYGKPYIVTLNY